MKIERRSFCAFFCYLSEMKGLLIFISALLIIGCISKEFSIQQKEEKLNSRILNNELKESLSHLIELRKNVHLEERRGQFTHSSPFVQILTTKEFAYVHISVMDCLDTSFYSFEENLDGKNYQILVDANSIKPERYFDLKDLEVVPRKMEDGMLCHDWYWVKARYKRIGNKLKLEKASTFFDNLHSENFYDKEDSAFLYQSKILIAEPEPEPEPTK